VIVGREHELETLGAFLSSDGAVFALIEGEAGIGKTALWGAALARVDGQVLVARPSAAETASSFAALDDLVRPAVDLLPRVPEVPRSALAAALLLEPAAGPPDPRAVGAGVLALLGELAPVVVAVDDWQWLDEASAAVLGYVLRRLPGDVRVLATLRTGEADGQVAALVRALPEGAVLQLAVDPLGGEPLRQIVEERVGASLTPPALASLEERSRGNPLTAIELARAERHGGPVNATDVRRLLGARVAALSEPAREVARAAAALAAPTDELVGEAGLEEALVAEVLVHDDGRLRFAHPLFAAVVQERTPAPAWRALHRRLADVVADVEQRARHLAEAAEAPDAATAEALEIAAQQASARGAPVVAADLAERAGRLTPGDDVSARARRLLLAAEAALLSNDGGTARVVLRELVTELPPSPDRARALIKLAAIGADTAEPEEDRSLVDQALEEAGEDDALLAEIHLVFSDRWLSTGILSVRPHLERAVVHAERAGDAGRLVGALVGLAFNRFCLGEGVQREALRDAAALERDADPASSWLRADGMLTLQLALSGHYDEARSRLAQEIRVLSRIGNADVESFVHMYAAELEVRTGRFGAAVAHGQRCFEQSVGSEISAYEADARWARGLALAHVGRVAEARDDLRTAIEECEQVGDRIFVINSARALGLLELSCGDADAAARGLAPLPAEEARLGVGEPMIFQLDGDVAEACVLTGDLDGAAAAQARLERHTGRPWAAGAALRARGLIRGAEGRHEEAIDDHRAALPEFAAAGHPVEHARTLLALGTAQRRAKQRGAARESLQAALAAFSELGAVLWAERAEAEIARLGGRRAGDRDELTESERRIAELAAAGRPNKEIAAALFVSERTVESNLTRAYRKLGVRSRTELARRIPEEVAAAAEE
jgi:DNA-binding CsgD family transcriptional regulator